MDTMYGIVLINGTIDWYIAGAETFEEFKEWARNDEEYKGQIYTFDRTIW